MNGITTTIKPKLCLRQKTKRSVQICVRSLMNFFFFTRVSVSVDFSSCCICVTEWSFCWFRVKKAHQLREVNHCRAEGCGRDRMWCSTSIPPPPPHCSDRCSFVKSPADLNGALLLKHREAVSSRAAHLVQEGFQVDERLLGPYADKILFIHKLFSEIPFG